MIGVRIVIAGFAVAHLGCSQTSSTTLSVISSSLNTTDEPMKLTVHHPHAAATTKSDTIIQTSFKSTTSAEPANTSLPITTAYPESSVETFSATSVPVFNMTAAPTRMRAASGKVRGRDGKMKKARIVSLDQKGPRTRVGRIRAKNGVN